MMKVATRSVKERKTTKTRMKLTKSQVDSVRANHNEFMNKLNFKQLFVLINKYK